MRFGSTVCILSQTQLRIRKSNSFHFELKHRDSNDGEFKPLSAWNDTNDLRLCLYGAKCLCVCVCLGRIICIPYKFQPIHHPKISSNTYHHSKFRTKLNKSTSVNQYMQQHAYDKRTHSKNWFGLAKSPEIHIKYMTKQQSVQTFIA